MRVYNGPMVEFWMVVTKNRKVVANRCAVFNKMAHTLGFVFSILETTPHMKEMLKFRLLVMSQRLGW